MSERTSDKKFLVREMITKKNGKSSVMEKVVPVILFLIASISILTTVGIVFTLLKETFIFFERVNFFDFISGKEWLPFIGDSPKYGILPLITGTLSVTIIAMAVAIPLGLAIAIYLSEYATDKVRRTLKPILEILAGVPTIVYGYFALTFVTPLLKQVIPSLGTFNALSPGLVMGVMIIPAIASLSEDAMRAVPNAIREGALGLGATRLEVSLKVVFPAALSGIISSIVLGFSRAIGETMIVAVAAGATPTFGFDVTQSIQTMTSYIVQVSSGDAGFGTTIYYSIYAVGMTLFVFTFLMNVLSQYISKKYREEY